MKRYFKITCKACNVDMWEVTGAVKHKIGTENILISNAPFFFCETCGDVAYRKGLGITDILVKAYRDGYNTIIFEEEDLAYLNNPKSGRSETEGDE